MTNVLLLIIVTGGICLFVALLAAVSDGLRATVDTDRLADRIFRL